MSDQSHKPRRYPITGDPVDVYHTRLSRKEEAPRLLLHAEQHNITLSAALRDLVRRGMGLKSHLSQNDDKHD